MVDMAKLENARGRDPRVLRTCRFEPGYPPHARVAEPVYALVLGTSGYGHAGSTPVTGTLIKDIASVAQLDRAHHYE